MKYKKSVYKSLALISQLGISMMVPIALMVALGLVIDHYFNTVTVIPFMVIGMLAGGRNVYKMAMAVANDDEQKSKGKTEKEIDVTQKDGKDESAMDAGAFSVYNSV